MHKNAITIAIRITPGVKSQPPRVSGALLDYNDKIH
jgi:hypothetical protein